MIAFAPITNAWFGTLSPWSKIVIAAALSLLPGARQHVARAHLGPSFFDRADALVRGAGTGDLLEAANSGVAAVRLHRFEDRRGARDDRRRRRRLLRRLDGIARRSDRERRRAFPIRDSHGRGSSSRAFLGACCTASSWRSSGSCSAGIRRRGQSTRACECDQIEPKHNQGGSMKKKWMVLGAAVALVASLAVAGMAAAHGSKSGADEGHRAAEVGHAGPVRRLLRGPGERLLQAGRVGREDQGRGPRHRPRAGRARRAGGVRGRLAAEPLLQPRAGQRPRQHRAGLRPQRHDRGGVEERRHQRPSSR